MRTQPPDEVMDALERQWRESAILSAEVLDRLGEINRIYLNARAARLAQATLPERREGRGRQKEPLTLLRLTPAHRAALARCPFSLFTARFHDGEFWLQQSQAAREDTQHGATDSFAELALFYSWHLVQSNPVAARILLGMSESALAAFKRLPLGRLQQLPREVPGLVAARWEEDSMFWRGLLAITQRGIESRVTDMRLLGIQMMASALARRSERH